MLSFLLYYVPSQLNFVTDLNFHKKTEVVVKCMAVHHQSRTSSCHVQAELSQRCTTTYRYTFVETYRMPLLGGRAFLAVCSRAAFELHLLRGAVLRGSAFCV